MPETLYNFICKEDNFKTLNKLKLKFHETNEIIKIFLEDDLSQFDVLRNYLIKHSNHINLFMEIYFRDILPELTTTVFKVKLILIFFIKII